MVAGDGSRLVPGRGELHLDHVAHFVPDLDTAGDVLERAGFVLTPSTAQANRTAGGMVPSGMANRCIMLREGYVELLTAVSPSPLATQFEAAVGRYVGLHLLAFATDEPEEAFRRLEREGFRPGEPISLTRPVEDEGGQTHEARFTVMRVAPEGMPEGRVQILKHHTPDVVWQERWTAHPNGVEALEAVLICVEDPREAADRFGRFLGRIPAADGRTVAVRLERGACIFVSPGELSAVAPFCPTVPVLPMMIAAALRSRDVGATGEALAKAGFERRGAPDAAAPTYACPPCIGGFVTLVPEGRSADWAG